MRRNWEEIAKIAQDLRDRSIADVEPAIPAIPSELPKNVISLPRVLLSEAEVSLTEKTPESLLAELVTGAISSSAVTLAFLRRAGLAQKLASTPREVVLALLTHGRPIVSQSFFLQRLLNVQNISMIISRNIRSRLVLFTVYQYP